MTTLPEGLRRRVSEVFAGMSVTDRHGAPTLRLHQFLEALAADIQAHPRVAFDE
jgi:hypothetical protein